MRIIGPGKYGLINFASAFVAYFTLLVNYGFDLSATREIASFRGDKAKINEIFNSVLFAKINLLAVATVVFLACLFLVDKIRGEQVLFIFTFLGLLGSTVFPTWYFQGIEKLAATAVFNFIVRLVFTLSVFIFIKRADDYTVYALIVSVGAMVGGFSALIYALKRFGLNIRLPRRSEIKGEYKKGWVLFTSTVVINFYTTSNTVILGFFADSVNVGFYSAAMKLVAVVQGLVAMPLNLSLFPHIAAAFMESKDNGVRNLKKAVVATGGLTLAASLVTFFASGIVIKVIFGKSFLPAIATLRILAFVPFIIGLSNVFGVQGLLNLHQDRAFFWITGVGAGLSIALNLVLTPRLLENGTALSWLLTEVFITAACYLVLVKQGVSIIDIRYVRDLLSRKV